MTVGEPFPENSSGVRSHYFGVAARALLIGQATVKATYTAIEPPQVSILNFLSSLPSNTTPHRKVFAIWRTLLRQCHRLWEGREER